MPVIFTQRRGAVSAPFTVNRAFVVHVRLHRIRAGRPRPYIDVHTR